MFYAFVPSLFVLCILGVSGRWEEKGCFGVQLENLRSLFGIDSYKFLSQAMVHSLGVLKGACTLVGLFRVGEG